MTENNRMDNNRTENNRTVNNRTENNRTENNRIEDQVIILIPSLDPDERFLEVIRGVKTAGFSHIVCVDDGSSLENKKYFKQAGDEYDCDILTHCVNLGKGRGLKTGFNEICNKYPDCVGAVTVDGDGQHTVKDIIACAKALVENPNSLIMGCRDFKQEQVPARSRFGNVTTSRVMGILCGIRLSDTQTGLRGIPLEMMKQLMNVSGERFEYELNMILSSKEWGISIKEVPIETVYLEENKSSHFRPLQDSVKIYAQFGKFIFSSLSSFVVDIILFTLMMYLTQSIWPDSAVCITVSTVTARVFSALYNYTVNKNAVFKNKDKAAGSLLRYIILAVCQCAVSAALVTVIYKMTRVSAPAIKVVVDTCLFIISFQIQREWVFRR